MIWITILADQTCQVCRNLIGLPNEREIVNRRTLCLIGLFPGDRSTFQKSAYLDKCTNAVFTLNLLDKL